MFNVILQENLFFYIDDLQSTLHVPNSKVYSCLIIVLKDLKSPLSLFSIVLDPLYKVKFCQVEAILCRIDLT